MRINLRPVNYIRRQINLDRRFIGNGRERGTRGMRI